MSQFDNTPIMPSSSGTPGPAGWVQTWIKAVTQPNEQTFVEISESPDAKPNTAYLWIFLAVTITYLIIGIFQALLTGLGISGQSSSTASIIGGSLMATLCISPIAGAISVLFFGLGVAIVQWIAKLFGGTGTYDKLVYAVAAFYVPITLVSAIFAAFSSVPYVNICTGLFSLILSFYGLFLHITAVKAVNRFGWGQAIGSVLLPFVVILVVCGCIVGIGFAVMGATIGDIFYQINHSLQTP